MVGSYAVSYFAEEIHDARKACEKNTKEVEMCDEESGMTNENVSDEIEPEGEEESSKKSH